MLHYHKLLALIAVAALERSLKVNDAAHDYAAPVLARAMQEIDPDCSEIPHDLSQATWEVIEWLMCGKEKPEWVNKYERGSR